MVGAVQASHTVAPIARLFLLVDDILAVAPLRAIRREVIAGEFDRDNLDLDERHKDRGAGEDHRN